MTTVLKHPLVDHRMTYMRDVSTRQKLFRKVAEEVVLVPILRAGMGMLDAMLHVLPDE